MNERTIFLLDGAGAILSIGLLGVVHPAIQPWIGMPLHILYLLTAWASCSLLYDAFCFWFADHRNPRWLRGIMAANTLYCCLTGVLIVVHLNVLTPWGVAYFVSEMPVLLGLVWFQRRLFQRVFHDAD